MITSIQQITCRGDDDVPFTIVLSAYFGFVMIIGVSLSIVVWRALVMWVENKLLSLTLFYLSTIAAVCFAAVNGLRDIQLGSFLSLTALTHLGVLGVLVLYYIPICYFIVTTWISKNRIQDSGIETNYHVFDDDYLLSMKDSLDDL